MNLQKLKHDKFLCRNEFPRFVESWNFVADRTMNLKGDKDVNPDIGAIQVDNTDPLHPVIRFNAIGLDVAKTPVDSQTAEVSSIQWKEPPDEQISADASISSLSSIPHLQLFNFDNDENDGTLSVEIDDAHGSFAPTDSSGNTDYDFLVRQDGVLKYVGLQVGTDLTGGGGGGANPISAIGNVSNSQVVEIDNIMRFTNMSDSNVSVEITKNGNYTDVKFGVYYI